MPQTLIWQTLQFKLSTLILVILTSRWFMPRMRQLLQPKARRLMKLSITSTKMVRQLMMIMWPSRLNLRVKSQLMRWQVKRPMGLGQLIKALRQWLAQLLRVIRQIKLKLGHKLWVVTLVILTLRWFIPRMRQLLQPKARRLMKLSITSTKMAQRQPMTMLLSQ